MTDQNQQHPPGGPIPTRVSLSDLYTLAEQTIETTPPGSPERALGQITRLVVARLIDHVRSFARYRQIIDRQTNQIESLTQLVSKLSTQVKQLGAQPAAASVAEVPADIDEASDEPIVTEPVPPGMTAEEAAVFAASAAKADEALVATEAATVTPIAPSTRPRGPQRRQPNGQR